MRESGLTGSPPLPRSSGSRQSLNSRSQAESRGTPAVFAVWKLMKSFDVGGIYHYILVGGFHVGCYLEPETAGQIRGCRMVCRLTRFTGLTSGIFIRKAAE
jgi:hypothetical protein